MMSTTAATFRQEINLPPLESDGGGHRPVIEARAPSTAFLFHTLMVQGTTSDAGKTNIVAALCRLLWQRGVEVVPFKPQNMALNSAVTSDWPVRHASGL